MLLKMNLHLGVVEEYRHILSAASNVWSVLLPSTFLVIPYVFGKSIRNYDFCLCSESVSTHHKDFIVETSAYCTAD